MNGRNIENKLFGTKLITATNFLFALVILIFAVKGGINYTKPSDFLGVAFFILLCIAFVQLGYLTHKKRAFAIKGNKIVAIVGLIYLFPLNDLIAVNQKPYIQSYGFSIIILLFIYYIWLYVYLTHTKAKDFFK